MACAHVFIVNEQTFPYHLKYRFAGTTAGQSKSRHIGLLADIARTRKGDKLLFYLQGVGFFGVYEVESEYPIIEPLNGWLQEELGIPLIYRVRIRPDQVYPHPVSEWKAVDELPKYSREVRWSLIYRKLKGERGCSYLFPHEYEGLVELIRSANQQPLLSSESHLLLYDSTKSVVCVAEEESPPYEGSQQTAEPHLFPIKKEAHLQAWLVWHVGRSEILEKMIPPSNLIWFANEVYAGAGMQKIDLLCIWQHNESKEYGVYELKDGVISESNIPDLVGQTRRYVWWVDSYVREQSDRVKVFWVVRGWRSSKQALRQIVEEEGKKGVSAVEVWEWGIQGETPTFRLAARYPE